MKKVKKKNTNKKGKNKKKKIKIWYSVTGEGMGHGVRSDSILEKLIKNKDYEIRISAAEKAYDYLKKKYSKFTKVLYIKGNTLVYRKNKISYFLSSLKFIIESPYKILFNTVRIIPFYLKFKPDIIISDFESASHYISKFFGTPCINIDNIHFQTEAKTDIKQQFFMKPLIRFLHPKSNYYIILSFVKLNLLKRKFKNKKRNKKREVVQAFPVVREIIKKAYQKRKKKDFVLVYQTSESNIEMVNILERTKNKYKVYGMKNQEKKFEKNSLNNIDFCDFNENKFTSDLATCKYVIVNGGFTTISEALFLKKPILSLPIKNHVEQIFNGMSLKKKGYGNYFFNLTKIKLDNFEKNLYNYENNLKKIDNKRFDEVFFQIDKLIEKIMKKQK